MLEPLYGVGHARCSLGGKFGAGLHIEITNRDVLYVSESWRADIPSKCVWGKAVTAFGGDGGVG